MTGNNIRLTIEDATLRENLGRLELEVLNQPQEDFGRWNINSDTDV